MRKKAEKKIRDAIANIGSVGNHRLDKVRVAAGLHPRVFDKTILDMARVGTIQLFTGPTDELSRDEISRLVWQDDLVFISFEFIDGTETASPPVTPPTITTEPPPINDRWDIEPRVLILDGLGMLEWQHFERLCKEREGRRPEEKIADMIRMYLNSDD